MKPENDTLRVERVQNGWIVFPENRLRALEGYVPDGALVATSPEMLADLLREWARGQQVKAD